MIAGDTHFDVARAWADNPTDTTADSDSDLVTVTIHEFGHALGLGHITVAGSVMEATYASARRTLTADEIAGITAIYGPSEEVPKPATVLLLGIGLIGIRVFQKVPPAARKFTVR